MVFPIRFSSFSFTYKSAERPALQIDELEIAAGEFCCIAGQNRAGKSTFCRVLSGIIPHFYHGELQGSAEILGVQTRAQRIHELAGIVGYVMDDPYAQLTRAACTVYDELAFGLQNIGMPAGDIHQRVYEVMQQMEISHLAERWPALLSSGEQQRVAMAAVFARQPDILVMDEASGQLDPLGAASVYEIARRYKDEGKTVLLVEPRLDSVLKYADKLIVLHEGRLVANGTPKDVLREGHLERLNLGLPSYPRLAKELAARSLVEDSIPIQLEEACRTVQEALHGAG